MINNLACIKITREFYMNIPLIRYYFSIILVSVNEVKSKFVEVLYLNKKIHIFIIIQIN